MGSQTPRAAVTTDCPARVGASLPLPGQDLGQVALDWLPKHLKAVLLCPPRLPGAPPQHAPHPESPPGSWPLITRPDTPDTFQTRVPGKAGAMQGQAHRSGLATTRPLCSPPPGRPAIPNLRLGDIAVDQQCPEASGRLARGPPPLHKGSTAGRRRAVPHRTGFPAAERGREEPVSASLLWPGNRLVFPVKPAWWPPVHPCRAPKWPQYPPPCVPRYCGHGASARHSR